MSDFRTIDCRDGTKIHYRSHGPGEFSAMVFSPKAQELLRGIEIKGVKFKDSKVPPELSS